MKFQWFAIFGIEVFLHFLWIFFFRALLYNFFIIRWLAKHRPFDVYANCSSKFLLQRILLQQKMNCRVNFVDISRSSMHSDTFITFAHQSAFNSKDVAAIAFRCDNVHSSEQFVNARVIILAICEQTNCSAFQCFFFKLYFQPDK